LNISKLRNYVSNYETLTLDLWWCSLDDGLKSIS